MAIVIGNGTDVASGYGIEIDLGREMVEIGIQRHLLVFVFDLTVAESNMSDGEIENVGVAVGFAWGRLGEIRLSLGIDLNVSDGMVYQ